MKLLRQLCPGKNLCCSLAVSPCSSFESDPRESWSRPSSHRAVWYHAPGGISASCASAAMIDGRTEMACMDAQRGRHRSKLTPSAAARSCDHIIALQSGWTIASGAPDDILTTDALHAIYGVKMLSSNTQRRYALLLYRCEQSSSHKWRAAAFREIRNSSDRRNWTALKGLEPPAMSMREP